MQTDKTRNMLMDMKPIIPICWYKKDSLDEFVFLPTDCQLFHYPQHDFGFLFVQSHYLAGEQVNNCYKQIQRKCMLRRNKHGLASSTSVLLADTTSAFPLFSVDTDSFSTLHG